MYTPINPASRHPQNHLLERKGSALLGGSDNMVARGKETHFLIVVQSFWDRIWKGPKLDPMPIQEHATRMLSTASTCPGRRGLHGLHT